jgi:succinate dehydrogenase / fumarate reductase cytochrome b subunit
MEPSQRPLSPHLQIYRPQLTSILSISHRAAGVALAVGTLLLVCWVISAASGPAALASLQSFLRSWFGMLLLFGWSVSLFYHLCNGIRHLFWDAGHGFDIRTAYGTSIVVLAAAAALTVIAFVAGLSVRG